jgi:hypothetical protein
MNDHVYVPFVVIKVEPSILCGNEWSWMNTWFKHDYDKWNISMIIHYHTEYLVQPWLRQRKHIHDHYQVFCVVMNDHGFVSFVVVMFEPSILCGNEWSWICFICRSHVWTKYSVWYHKEYLVQLWVGQTEHIHDHSLPHRILGSNMTTTNETYPWSFITTQNTWFKLDYDKYSVW